MTKINGDTIFSDTFKNLYYLVSGTVAGSVNGIYSQFPSLDSPNFKGYPICIIEAANVGKDSETFGNNNINNYGINSSITIHSKSWNTIDSISDKIGSALDAANKSETGTYASGLVHMDYQTSNGTNVINDSSIHYRGFGLSYEFN